MLIGSKPIKEMSDEELYAAIEELQSFREGLRNEAVKKAKEASTAPKPQPRAKAPTEAKSNNASWLAFLKGEAEDEGKPTPAPAEKPKTWGDLLK